MAWRGRGRGRGAGGVIRHDIQLREDEAIPDVPAVFPPTPGMPKSAQPVSAEDDPDTFRKRSRLVKMKGFFQRSPYHLKLTIEEKLEGSAPDVVQYVDMGTSVDTAVSKPRKQANSTPLHQLVVMHDKYLPAELYSAKEAAASMKKRNAAFFKKFGRSGQDEQREVNEAIRQVEEEKEGQEKDDDKDNEEEALPEEEDDDDELDHEDDDYYQGEYFDDDEEYGGDDGDSDGGGDAYF